MDKRTDGWEDRYIDRQMDGQKERQSTTTAENELDDVY